MTSGPFLSTETSLILGRGRVDIVSTSYSFSSSVELQDDTVLSDRWRAFEAGLRSGGTFSISGFIPAGALAGAPNLLYRNALETIYPSDYNVPADNDTSWGSGGKRWAIFCPEGLEKAGNYETAGQRKPVFAMAYHVASASVSASVGALVTFAADLQITGEVYRGESIAEYTEDDDEDKNASNYNTAVSGGTKVNGGRAAQISPSVYQVGGKMAKHLFCAFSLNGPNLAATSLTGSNQLVQKIGAANATDQDFTTGTGYINTLLSDTGAVKSRLSVHRYEIPAAATLATEYHMGIQDLSGALATGNTIDFMAFAGNTY